MSVEEVAEYNSLLKRGAQSLADNQLQIFCTGSNAGISFCEEDRDIAERLDNIDQYQTTGQSVHSLTPKNELPRTVQGKIKYAKTLDDIGLAEYAASGSNVRDALGSDLSVSMRLDKIQNGSRRTSPAFNGVVRNEEEIEFLSTGNVQEDIRNFAALSDADARDLSREDDYLRLLYQSQEFKDAQTLSRGGRTTTSGLPSQFRRANGNATNNMTNGRVTGTPRSLGLGALNGTTIDGASPSRFTQTSPVRNGFANGTTRTMSPIRANANGGLGNGVATRTMSPVRANVNGSILASPTRARSRSASPVRDGFGDEPYKPVALKGCVWRGNGQLTGERQTRWQTRRNNVDEF